MRTRVLGLVFVLACGAEATSVGADATNDDSGGFAAGDASADTLPDPDDVAADVGAVDDAAPPDDVAPPDDAADGVDLDEPSDVTAPPEVSDGVDVPPPPDLVEPPDVTAPQDVPTWTDTVDPPITCAAAATILSPTGGDFLAKGEPVTFTATVVDPDGAFPLTDYEVAWTTSGGYVVGQGPVASDGSASWTGTVNLWGPQTLRAEVRHVSGAACDGTPPETSVRFCKQHLSESFGNTLDPAVWLTQGDAYWDPGGWLEMTGNLQGHQGAIYSTSPKVAPGSVSIRFRFATGGGGDFTGADGFAATFMKAASLTEMEEWIDVAQGGGGLGYGAGGPYGAFEGDAFTVELDTWQNVLNGAEYHTDPTGEDHLELTQGLDPSASLAWYGLGDVETLDWHSVRVDISATHITVFYDDVAVIDTDVPDFQFRGGYVFFSGSTGYYANYHRFDDLELLHDCEK